MKGRQDERSILTLRLMFIMNLSFISIKTVKDHNIITDITTHALGYVKVTTIRDNCNILPFDAVWKIIAFFKCFNTTSGTI